MTRVILVVLWVIGLCAAGSDGDFMPFANLIGLLAFFIASVLIGKKCYDKYRCRPRYTVTYNYKETRHKLW